MSIFRLSLIKPFVLALVFTSSFCCITNAEDKNSPSPFFVPAQPISQPTDWKSSNNDALLDGSTLEIVGNGKTTEWLSNKLPFESRKVYSLTFKGCVAKPGDGGDCACVGIEATNMDFSGMPEDQTPQEDYSFVFFTKDVPDGIYNSSARFAQWETHKTYRFGNLQLCAVQPVYRLIADRANPTSSLGVIESGRELLQLGAGENIDAKGNYSFVPFCSSERTNFDRPLYSVNSGFNTNRWCLGAESTVVYRFALEPVKIDGDELHPSAPVPFSGGELTLSFGYWSNGSLAVDASRDGLTWSTLATISKEQSVGARLPLDDFFNNQPAEQVFIRFRGVQEENAGCHVQLNPFIINLQTQSQPNRLFIGNGDASFATLDQESQNESAPDAMLWGFDENNEIWAKATDSNRYLHLTLEDKLLTQLTEMKEDPYDSHPKKIEWLVNFKRPTKLVQKIFPYFIQKYTNLIPDVQAEGVDISWCEPDRRIPREPNVLEYQAPKMIQISSAKNDSESFQIALRPNTKIIRGLKAEICGDLKIQNGDETISQDNVQLRYAYYHYVYRPTDISCAQGWYPDALIPFEQGSDGLGASIDVLQGQNLPIWITIKTPIDAKSGKYNGSVRLTADEGQLDVVVPFELTVWDFALPIKNTLETAYGMNHWNIWAYHNTSSDEDKRAILEKYLQLFSDYRISIYNPTPMDPYKVEWLPNANPPSCNIDFTDFDREIARVFDKYHFTNFVLHFQGLGWGNFASRQEGSIAGFAPDTPQYQSMMADYGKKLQEHLREKGLLKAAYIYNFDEPDEKDYEFVARQFATVKKYAPEIACMLTEQPSKEFDKILEDCEANVDIWCPVSPAYNEETATVRRALGNRFWWYVCCFPKEPFCTEFTDHPALELRIWRWQAFERNIVGDLVWESTYWHSGTAYPDSYQNPYDDPMSWVLDGTLPAGTKSPWGNGDGRFVYPPLSATTPGQNDGKPIFDAPCASIRFEMLREGCEDYEMLTMLSNKLKEKGADLPAQTREKYESLFDFSPITTGMTRFTNDPQRIYERRAAIAEAIEALK